MTRRSSFRLLVVWLMVAGLLVAGLLVAGAGCAGPPPPLGGGCPVDPVPTQELPQPLRLRARLQLSTGTMDLHLEAAAQGNAEEVVMVGMAAFGARLLAVRQRGAELATGALASPELEAPALWIADALHRLYWIQAPAGAAPDGVTRWSRGTETVSEWRSGGRAVRRRYTRDDASGEVSIQYPEDGATGGAVIENPWCGYKARVVNLGAGGADPL